MNTNVIPLKIDAGKKPDPQGHENLEHDPHEYHIADGGEFLDDGVRMKDQPFQETSVKKGIDIPQRPVPGM